VKLHLLTHLQTDIRRFGPLVGCSTEVFESFNAIFRQCSVLSNRQAPSRDIAAQFGKLEGFKHRVTSGWWRADDKTWVQVGQGIKRFVANNQEILESVGLSSGTSDVPGMFYLCYYKFSANVALLPGAIKLVACKSEHGERRQRPKLLWETTKASRATNHTSFLHIQNQPLYPIQYLVARSTDRCEVGSWVIICSPYVCIWRYFSTSYTHRWQTELGWHVWANR
jgi:hypothetical protein